jgi:hypothetical protein
LKGIADDRQIDGHISVASPLRDLIEQYNKIAINNDNLPHVLSTSTGAELKKAVGMTDPEVQVVLLYKYSVATKTLDTPTIYAEDPVKADERKFRLYVAKVFITGLIVLMLVVIGAVIALSVNSGVLANEGLISTIMTTAAEIIKVMLGSK